MALSPSWTSLDVMSVYNESAMPRVTGTDRTRPPRPSIHS